MGPGKSQGVWKVREGFPDRVCPKTFKWVKLPLLQVKSDVKPQQTRKSQGKNEIVLGNVLENVNIAHFNSIFVVAKLLINFSQGKTKSENKNLKIMNFSQGKTKS